MSRRIAVISPNSRTFGNYLSIIRLEDDTIHFHIKSLEDLRGREFTGYVVLRDYYGIKDVYKIIETIKTKINEPS